MAEFLTTQGTSYHIENVITNAKNKMVLISPYLKLSKTFFERLKDADRRGVKITLVYGKKDLNSDEGSKLKQLDNLSLHFVENLHAKCYFNEECMVITSMNMYDFSEKNNREMGVLIRAEDDSDVFSKAVKEAKSIVDACTKDSVKKAKNLAKSSSISKHRGYCIRCGEAIHFSLGKPLCSDCYRIWARYKDPDYNEYFCHRCGGPESTTIDRPLCSSCYRKSLI